MNTGLFTGKEPHTKQKKFFALELRSKTNLQHRIRNKRTPK